jgi:hypothetical protein
MFLKRNSPSSPTKIKLRVTGRTRKSLIKLKPESKKPALSEKNKATDTTTAINKCRHLNIKPMTNDLVT